MLTTSDVINYSQKGFDGEKYIQLQKEKILERISQFSGKLYLEIGGKFLYDPHASRVLPGFFPDSKKQIFVSLSDRADIIFCVNAKDIANNRQLSSDDMDYEDVVLKMLEDIKKEVSITAKIAINRVTEKNKTKALEFKKTLGNIGYQAYLRYEIEGYPNDTQKVLSEQGYGADEYIPTEKSLVLVTGAASSSGKMSTCLGQIYQDKQRGIDSGYAKYETFPVWNLDIDHPVNLAYEAATADIGDYNTMDSYYKNAYGKESVNYNRDVEAFEIVSQLASKFLPEDNFTRQYKSPTDMGISNAGFCITNDRLVSEASIEEIKRRKAWYKQIVERGEGDNVWIERCERLLDLVLKK